MIPTIITQNFDSSWGIDISQAPSYKRAAAINEAQIGLNTLYRFSNIGAHLVDFEGAPETVDTRVVRQSILWYPITVFFVVGDSTLCLPGLPTGRGWNVQGNFGSACAVGLNGHTYQIRLQLPGSDKAPILDQTSGIQDYDFDYDGVCIRANDNCFPFINVVLKYTEWIAYLLQSLDIAKFYTRHPVNFTCTPKQRATAIKWFKETDDGIPVTFTPSTAANNGAITRQVEAVNLLQGGDVLKPTMEMIDWLEQRFYMEAGVENMGSQVDKKGENMINAEVNASDEITNIIRQGMVDYINDQLEKMGVRKLPGMENFRCVVRKGTLKNEQTNDVRTISEQKSESLPGEPSANQ